MMKIYMCMNGKAAIGGRGEAAQRSEYEVEMRVLERNRAVLWQNFSMVQIILIIFNIVVGINLPSIKMHTSISPYIPLPLHCNLTQPPPPLARHTLTRLLTICQ